VNISSLLDLWRDALTTAAVVGGPFLIASLAVGLVVSLIQAATQLQENVLSFVPKLIAIGLVMALAGHSLLDKLTRYTSHAVEQAATIGQEARQ